MRNGLRCACFSVCPDSSRRRRSSLWTCAADAERDIRDFCQQPARAAAAGPEELPGIRLCAPQAGMFMLLDVRGTGHSGREFMHALYRSQRVSVMDGGAFGHETAGFVRICFASDEATLIEACRRIRAFLHSGCANSRRQQSAVT